MILGFLAGKTLEGQGQKGANEKVGLRIGLGVCSRLGALLLKESDSGEKIFERSWHISLRNLKGIFVQSIVRGKCS